ADMKPVSRLSIRCAFGSLSKSMSLLLLTPLLLALAQPIASQVYVNSSTYNDNTRSPADQTQESLRPSPPTGRTDVLDESNYQRPKTEELTNRIASVGDYEEGKPTLNGQPKAINNNTVEKILMKPSKIYTEVDLTTQSLSPNNRTERGLGRTQHTTMKPVTKVPTQKTGGYSENEATTFISIKQHFGETTIADAVHKKAIPDTSEEDLKSMSEVSLPTAVSLASTDSSTDSDHTDDAQMSHTFLTTESTTHIKTTVGLVLQARISTATVANKKQLTSVNFPGVAHWMNMSGADLG
ncbi:proline-rich transmembrane protein 3, partial [Clarias magur]